MDQTPVHDNHNPDLLRVVPASSSRLIEIGCSSGAMAREFKKLNPRCHYVGVDIDERYVELAARHCDLALAADIERNDDAFFETYRDRDCWIFGDTLEHLQDPWRILRRIRTGMPGDGCVVACIPNAQHWSVQVQLSVGDFVYQDSGLLDRTHLRWFTRKTMLALFEDCGFAVVEGFPRIFHEPASERFLPLIAELARKAGADAETAVMDARPLQYVVRAVPR